MRRRGQFRPGIESARITHSFNIPYNADNTDDTYGANDTDSAIADQLEFFSRRRRSFLSNHDASVAPKKSASNFTVSSGTMDAELIFVSQYSGNVFIMPAGEAQKFVNGSSFNYFPALSMPAGKFGFISISLSIGDYAVGVENSGTAANTVRVELQHTPKVAGFHFRQERFAPVTESLKPGTRFTQPVTTGSTYRTVIDGANTGGSIYLIPQSEVSKFMANQTFSYYTDQPCSSGSAAPGFCELKYAPGTYVIAYVNDTSEQQSIVMYGRDYIPD